MKTFRVDNYTIKTRKMKGNSNYELSLNVFKNQHLIYGTVLKTDSTDLKILEAGIEAIKNDKNPVKKEELFNI